MTWGRVPRRLRARATTALGFIFIAGACASPETRVSECALADCGGSREAGGDRGSGGAAGENGDGGTSNGGSRASGGSSAGGGLIASGGGSSGATNAGGQASSGGTGPSGGLSGFGGGGWGGASSSGGTLHSGGTSGGAPASGGQDGSGGATGPLLLTVRAAGLLDGTSTDWEQARDVAVDDLGNMYVVGGTSSPDFPVTAGAYDTTYNTGGTQLGSRGASDGFITKLDPTGAIVWSTYLGSPNYDRIYAVEVDAAHNVYVAGRAGSGFPTTSSVLQPSFAGDSVPSSAYGSQDGFVAKLSADGSTLLWSTYFGESGQGFVRDLALDASGSVHIAASSFSGSDASLKVTAGAAQPTLRGVCDSFYARLAADGRQVEYGTFLGGNDAACYSSNPAVRVRSDGAVFFLAGEPGAGAPTTPQAYQTIKSGGDDFLLARFEADGSLGFCSYLGGTANESLDTHSLALTLTGEPLVAAATASPDYPVTDASTHKGGRDVAVSILSEDGASLLASTMVGGTGPDGGEGVGIDAQGNVYVSGFTNSPTLPVTAGAVSGVSAGALEGILLVLSPDLRQVRYLAYDGITAEYGNRSSVVSPSGDWAIVGAVWKVSPFPATGTNDKQIDGLHGAFFRRLGP
jgi:Beta-propeller repeat